ncbi:thiol reductant ABC exporter subunit CydD [Dictyobacter arantiisoli]|uniref:Thiol reductant ABC exporter subunit CydD n=1 Tax=Dictyobacter arantiisoli TaxID=2014874 RepID=A0A5A5TKK4_9CHLR|nr:thiol reductant ABC exporter subunit CydD [Dictyobacter arantiisoli]GCF11589.1 thiol reductant ABC exporter subunit CydD [Dictyobacter arantiisoli]
MLTVLISLFGTVITIVQMTLLSHIVNQVFLLRQNLAQNWRFLLFLLAAILVQVGLVWIREVSAQRGAMRAKAELREKLFAHLFALGPAYTRDERTGELVTTASEGIERLDAYLSRYLPQMYLSVLVPLLIACYVFPLDWGSALILLITCPIIPLLMILVGSYAEVHMQRQWTALSRMGAQFLDAVQGLPTLKLFGRSAAEQERVERASNGVRDKTLKVLRLAFLSGGVLEFLTTVAIGLVAVTLGIRLLDGGISFQNAFLILLLAPEFYRPLRDLGVHRHAGMEGKAAAIRLQEILRTPVARDELSKSEEQPVPEGGGAGKIALTCHNLTYTYPQAEQPALSDVSLTLPMHTCTALVGQSGAGKSTLVNLLLRFQEPQEGNILINGRARSELSLEQWREQIALVPQRPHLFYGTVRDNILLARPAARALELQMAAELAGAAEFIVQLPQGYDTMIGEQGARLSAGQIQRLALARAFLKDAPLLILDEPTSHLDIHSEALIRQALQRLMQQRTVLVIAHRLNTIAHADQIAVLATGKLVELGQHADLLQQSGLYARLLHAHEEEVVAL